jgi:hypothetical protein
MRCNKKCKDKCDKYKKLYFNEKNKNDKLLLYMEELLETQQKIVDYIDQQKDK